MAEGIINEDPSLTWAEAVKLANAALRALGLYGYVIEEGRPGR